jgi:hypothetical protein
LALKNLNFEKWYHVRHGITRYFPLRQCAKKGAPLLNSAQQLHTHLSGMHTRHFDFWFHGSSMALFRRENPDTPSIFVFYLVCILGLFKIKILSSLTKKYK